MMERINIAVVDDEPVIVEQIRSLIEKSKVDCHIDSYLSGEELLGTHRYYDIIFMDIQMKGNNGIEVAGSLRKQGNESILIFVTSIKEYVFEAFDVMAFHYLLKPIEEKRFETVWERAVKECQKSRAKRAAGKEVLFIKTKSRNITLGQENIVYIENRGKKVEIHTIKEIIAVYASMRELEEQLNGSFFRCHRGYLVNMAHIAEYESDSICLRNGETIFMAKERYPHFVKAYMHYLREGGGICV